MLESILTNLRSHNCLFLVSALHSSQNTKLSFDFGSECLLKHYIYSKREQIILPFYKCCDHTLKSKLAPLKIQDKTNMIIFIQFRSIPSSIFLLRSISHFLSDLFFRSLSFLCCTINDTFMNLPKMWMPAPFLLLTNYSTQ